MSSELTQEHRVLWLAEWAVWVGAASGLQFRDQHHTLLYMYCVH